MDLAGMDTRPILLVTTVDIGEGKAGKIEIREGDDPVEAAREFCRQYGLPDTIVGPLSIHICENIERSIEEMEQASARSATADPACAAGLPSQSSAQPDSPALDAYLPDDSPGTSDPPTQHPLPPFEQPSPPPYEAQDTAAAPPHGHPVPHSGDEGGTLHLPQQQRPASAPHPQENELLSRATAAAAEVRRPASVNGGYGGRDRPSSSGSGGSGGNGRNPAHNRLYADYFSKQSRLEEERRLRDLEVQLKMQQVHVTPVSQHLASHRNAAGYKNYGERLYVEGRLDAMRKEKEAERVKQEEEEEELAECVFQPEISKLARTLKAAEGDTGGAAWQRLYQRGQIAAKRQERMETIKKEQEEEEVKECTFQPRINHKSSKLIEDRQTILRESGIPGYEQLFNDSIRRQLKQEHLARQAPEEATFRPRINTSSVVLRRLMEGRQGGEEGGIVGGDVSARLLERGRKYQERLQQAKEVLHGKVDPSTGKPLYRPQTCRAPRYARNPTGQPIGEYLYAIQQERQEKMAHVLNRTKQRADEHASSTYVNKRSEKLVEKLKRERFRAIYDYLCRGDPEAPLNLVGVVQDEGFMDTIDPEVRADIEYAAKQLSKYMAKRDADLQDSADSAAGGEQQRPLAYASSKQGEVDPQGFHALMEEVLARTAGISRQYLLPMPSVRKKFEEPTFKPVIDPKSKLIAARRRPDNLPAYEVLYKTAEEMEHKREEKKKLQEMAQMEECVFNPRLESKQLAKEGKALKLAATLSMCRRGQEGEHGHIVDQHTPAAAVATAQQELEQFDHIERQIQDALVRLSLSGEAMAAAAQQAAAGGMKSHRGSLDCTALFGSPSCTPAGSSLGHFNPLDGGDSPQRPARQTTLEWCESGNDLVANIIDQGTFEGLDLHAIASASIAMDGGNGALAQQAATAAAPLQPNLAAIPLSPAGSAV